MTFHKATMQLSQLDFLAQKGDKPLIAKVAVEEQQVLSHLHKNNLFNNFTY